MKPWHSFLLDDVYDLLRTMPSKGLSSQDAIGRLKIQGANRLQGEESCKWYTVFLRQFANFLILILAFAAGLSFLLGDHLDAFAILAIVVLNGILGFVQEWKAENALKQLKKMLRPQCRVLRDGRVQEITAETLVRGDILLLDRGNFVPADVRVIESVNLRADEAALTGESVPVEKTSEAVPEDAHISDRSSMVWMGTHIVNGQGRGVVVATGMDTEFGRIAALTGEIRETETRLQRQLAVFAKQLTFVIVGVTTLVMLLGWWGGKEPLQMFMAGISLAVSAIPEGLPAVVTITLALGVRVMARKKALLRHLQTAETLGATSVICTDKTGTLTKNEMTVQSLWLASGEISIRGAGYEPYGDFIKDGQAIDPLEHADLRAFLETGQRCNHAEIEQTPHGWVALGSPTEAALITVARKAGLSLAPHREILCELSFDSTRKRMSITERQADGTLLAHVKGAPEVLLARADKILMGGQECPLDDAMRTRIEDAYKGFARQGLRTLALAYKRLPEGSPLDEAHVENALTFLGVAGIIDPPRNEVEAAIAKTQTAGIHVIMITGDSPDTALTIAQQVGLPAQRALTSEELKHMSDAELCPFLTQETVFARTVPEDKYRIVRLLQHKNRLVAMTGDGVNDAPALKQADIGIAMGIRGTDVAKGAADMVLSDDNFASIVSAIEEGRRQYSNIRKFVSYLVASNFGETLAVFINILTGAPLILLPIQILWVNLVTDSVTALSLGFEKSEAQIMQRPPRDVNQPILNRRSVMALALFGSYIGAATLAIYHIDLTQSSIAHANTLAFTTMVVLANILVLNFRSFQKTLYKIGFFSNPWLLFAIILMIIFQVLAVYAPPLQAVLKTVPLDLWDWGRIVTLSLPMLLISELYKKVRF